MELSPLAGKPADPSLLVNVPKLVMAYYAEIPDPMIPEQRVAFGTSGHRGSSLKHSFNERHILAITQAICMYRKQQRIDGPLFLGMDTHALSWPAYASALEVLGANDVHLILSQTDEYTPTPVISHAILTYNRGRTAHLADGIVITPSHNPPDEGGFKYDPPSGGPAESKITDWIQTKANELMQTGGVKRLAAEKTLRSPNTSRKDLRGAYIEDLAEVIDMEAICRSKIHIGVDPLGGAGVHYWDLIRERYKINLEIVSRTIDPTFGFMSVDWDGKIRMDPSSSYAMQRLLSMKDRFDVSLGCDTDHDRHGVATKSGLMPSNHYLSAMIYYLFQHRPQWKASAAIGKTIVSSSMIDRVAAKLKRKVVEVPVGFKWFVEGLLAGSLGFAGEESAGASFLRKDGSVWTTDKDGIVPALLAAEITAKMGKTPSDVYRELTQELGESYYRLLEGQATPAQKERLRRLSANELSSKELAGEPIEKVETVASGNQAPIGGIKVATKSGWFAARPSGTEQIYKIYAESFKSKEHLSLLQQQAKHLVERALG